jgi:hypothetical protein
VEATESVCILVNERAGGGRQGRKNIACAGGSFIHITHTRSALTGNKLCMLKEMQGADGFL